MHQPLPSISSAVAIWFVSELREKTASRAEPNRAANDRRAVKIAAAAAEGSRETAKRYFTRSAKEAIAIPGELYCSDALNPYLLCSQLT